MMVNLDIRELPCLTCDPMKFYPELTAATARKESMHHESMEKYILSLYGF